MDRTRGWSLHLGLPKTASTLLQNHLFGCHPDLDYLGKLRAKWISPEVEKFVRLITKAQELDDSLALWMREGYIEPAIRRGRLPVLSNEGLSAGLPERHEKRAEFLKQIWSPCSVLFFIRHPLRLVESLYFHRLRQYARKGMNRPHMRDRLGGRLYFDVNEWLEANLEARVGAFNLLDYARALFRSTAGFWADRTWGFFSSKNSPGIWKRQCNRCATTSVSLRRLVWNSLRGAG